MPKGSIILQGFDVLDMTRQIARLNKKQQAVLLSNVENILGRSNPKYNEIRKLILDSTNDFSRTVVSFIFGDIDF